MYWRENGWSWEAGWNCENLKEYRQIEEGQENTEQRKRGNEWREKKIGVSKIIIKLLIGKRIVFVSGNEEVLENSWWWRKLAEGGKILKNAEVKVE